MSAAAAGTLRLGDELEVNRLGYGAMRLTGPGIWGPPRDRAEARNVLRRAVDLQVNFIDTAHAYGPEANEELLAEALHPYPAELVLATKSGQQRGGPDDWFPDGRPDTLRRELERSLQLLRVDRIDLFFLHRPDPAVPIEDSVGELATAQQAGKIRLIGVSNVDLVQLERALDVADVAAVQNRYSLVDRGSEAVLELCIRRGIVFVPWYPLAAGDAARDERLLRVAERSGATAAQVAIAWLLARSAAMLPIPGTSSVAHLEENVAAAGVALTDGDLAVLDGLAG